MFHRRLLLLSGLAAVSFVPLLAQVSRLTITKGDSLRAEAETRLVRRTYTPTVRGRILDRKGRVLAQDRPSFAVTASYSVITGDWANNTARDAARKIAGVRWSIMSPDDRADLIAQLVPTFKLHLEDGWSALAHAAGISRDELDRRRDDVIARVESRYQAVMQQRRDKEIQQLINISANNSAVPVDIAGALLPTATPAVIDADLRARFRLDERAARALELRIAAPIEEQRASHVLLPHVPDSAAFAVRAMAADDVSLTITLPGTNQPAFRVDRVPGIEVTDAGDRDYPLERLTVELDRSTLPSPIRDDTPASIQVQGLACHVLGRLRNQVQAEDAPARAAFLNAHAELKAIAIDAQGIDRGTYRDGDRIGQDGIERSQENILRGLRGLQTRFVDSGKDDLLPPVPGKDVALTLDAMLQARVQAIMSPAFGLATVQPWQGQESDTQPVGSNLNGAAVVLDIDTGDILALVSTPTFTLDQLRTQPDAIFNDPVNTPWLNRAVDKPYPPGSIVKALMLNGAVQHGNYALDQRIACTGHLLPNQPNILQCWIWKRHKTTHSAVLGADLDGPEAVMVSCNIFFFTLGRRMGPQTITQVYREFGVGTPFDLGIGGEFVGQLGEDTNGKGLEIGDAIQMGIGQGPVSWTPLHAANSYAIIARGGVRVPPRIIANVQKSSSSNLADDLRLDQNAVSASIEGLRLAVNDDRGSGHHINIDDVRETIFNIPGIKVWGKTGTAAAPDIKLDPDGQDGPLSKQVVKAGDHSWFVVMAGRDRPRFAIAVVIDYGGSGAKVSGPITNQIIAALVKEGYL